MINIELKSLLQPLLTTISAELPVYWLGSHRKKDSAIGAILINIFTNPLVLFFHIYILTSFPWWQSFAILEVVTVVVEGFLFSLITETAIRRAILLSLCANAISASLGFLF